MKPEAIEAVSVNDPGLPERIRRRDPAALRAVVEAYLGQILRAARGAGLDLQESEEVVQATFTTFLETAQRFEGRSSVRTWLFGILYRKISEARRGLGRARQLDDIDGVMESRFRADGRWARPPRPADADTWHREIRGAIDECLGTVPSAQRMAFVLREVEELTTEEICNVLEVTPTNLGVMMYRVRNRLRDCLEARGISGPEAGG
ncbi:MAG: sigma-70 family RNA polymerase sigma factor [Gemmatimonadota bacterium]